MKFNEQPRECQITQTLIYTQCNEKERKQVLEHIKHCEVCRCQYEEAREMDALFEKSVDEVPEELHEYIMKGVRKEQQQKSFLTRFLELASKKSRIVLAACAAMFCLAMVSSPMVHYMMTAPQRDLEQEQIRALNERIAQLEDVLVGVLENNNTVSTDDLEALTTKVNGAATSGQVDSIVEALEKVITEVEKNKDEQDPTKNYLLPLRYEGLQQDVSAYLFFYNGRIRIIIGDNIYVCQGIQKADRLILTEENDSFTVALLRSVAEDGSLYYIIEGDVPFSSIGVRIK